MHLDLTTTSQSIAGTAANRTFGMLTTDTTAVVHIYAADAASVSGTSNGVFIAELTYKTPKIEIVDGSTYLYYVLKSGTVTGAVWADAQSLPGQPPAGSGTVGGVQLSVAPVSPSTPIAVGTNDVRVTTIEQPITLSASGVLAEYTLQRPAPGVACTLVSVSLAMDAAVAANDTNYTTLTVAKRNGSGGGATTIVAGTTKVTGGVNSGGGLLAFQEVSLGTLSVTALLAADEMTFTGASTGTGSASGGHGKLRITYTVP